MKIPSLLLAAMLLPATGFAEIQFKGVVVDGNGKVKVSLFNSESYDSHWVAINGKFGGYTLVSYKPGRPANPANPKETAIKDSVVLSLPGGSTQTVALSDSILVTTPATTLQVNADPAQPTSDPLMVTSRLVKTSEVLSRPDAPVPFVGTPRLQSALLNDPAAVGPPAQNGREAVNPARNAAAPPVRGGRN